MKKLTFLILITILWSCSGDDPEVTPIEVEVEDFSATISENPEVGDVLGTVDFSVTSGTATFSLISVNPSGALAINASSGQLTVADASLFDYEDRTSISATVNATADTESASATVTITLQDVIEAPRDGLIAEYLFEGDADDTSGNGYDSDSLTATLTTGRFDDAMSAYAFDGSQYISVGDYAALSPNNVSVSLWFKSSSTIETQRFIFVGSQSDVRQNYSLNYNVSGSEKSDFRYEPPTPLAGGTFAQSTTTVTDGEWHHAVGVRDNSARTLKIYIDGTLEHTVTYLNDPVAADYPVQFGRSFHNTISQHYTGILDDVRIYDKVLTDDEIGLLFNEEAR